jgi:hypothetical protein
VVGKVSHFLLHSTIAQNNSLDSLEMEGRTHMKILIKEEDKGGGQIIVANIKLGYINKHFDMVFHIFCLPISVV